MGRLDGKSKWLLPLIFWLLLCVKILPVSLLLYIVLYLLWVVNGCWCKKTLLVIVPACTLCVSKCCKTLHFLKENLYQASLTCCLQEDKDFLSSKPSDDELTEAIKEVLKGAMLICSHFSCS